MNTRHYDMLRELMALVKHIRHPYLHRSIQIVSLCEELVNEFITKASNSKLDVFLSDTQEALKAASSALGENHTKVDSKMSDIENQLTDALRTYIQTERLSEIHEALSEAKTKGEASIDLLQVESTEFTLDSRDHVQNLNYPGKEDETLDSVLCFFENTSVNLKYLPHFYVKNSDESNQLKLVQPWTRLKGLNQLYLVQNPRGLPFIILIKEDYKSKARLEDPGPRTSLVLRAMNEDVKNDTKQVSTKKLQLRNGDEKTKLSSKLRQWGDIPKVKVYHVDLVLVIGTPDKHKHNHAQGQHRCFRCWVEKQANRLKIK
ncbi:hypothetical protein FRC02_001536 [Tulasnella sp. 418]|nr:hypothetical protein FRC02_001536 [Tulasnella sp. 418]